MTNITFCIRKLREEKNYTQEYMASQLGISTKSYSNLENSIHQLSIERLYKISEILNVPLLRILKPEVKEGDLWNELKELYTQQIENLREENRILKCIIDKKSSA